MSLTFKVMLRRVLQHEGGFVDHPKDPGGATNKGITQKTYDKYRKDESQPSQSVKLITDAEVEDIYATYYFVGPNIDELPPALAFQVFDAAVNSGPTRAIEWLQAAVGTAIDGKLGPKTLDAAKQWMLTVELSLATIDTFLGVREDFLRGLSTWKTFGKGWQARINQNWQYAKGDVHEQG